MGTPYFADVALRGLLDNGYRIELVVTAPDKPSGRGGKIAASTVSETAKLAGIETVKPTSKTELIEMLAEVDYDLIIVAAFGMIIPIKILDKATLGSFNIHGSILPKYRGASPITAAILNGDKETGVTIMKISEKMDEGDIITISKIPITGTDTTATLTTKLADLGSELLVNTLPKIINKTIALKPQNNNEATYCTLIRKSDGEIDFSKKAEEIERMIRAYQPWPSAYTHLAGKMIKILEAETIISNKKIEPGKLINANGKLLLGTGQGILNVLKIQPEGKKPMTSKDFINGNYIK